MAPLFAHIHLYGTLHREVKKEQTNSNSTNCNSHLLTSKILFLNVISMCIWMLQLTGYEMMVERPHSLTTNLPASNQENIRHAFPYFFRFLQEFLCTISLLVSKKYRHEYWRSAISGCSDSRHLKTALYLQ